MVAKLTVDAIENFLVPPKRRCRRHDSWCDNDLVATLDQIQGCLLGLSLGDALGAPFEGGILERLLWRLIGSTRQGQMRWTDDTQMSIDVIESFLRKGVIDPDDLALTFAKSYRWSRGYGPQAAKVLRRIAKGADWRVANRSGFASGSYGNGAAMRAPIVGLIFASQPAKLLEATALTASITHAHPLGVEGAVLLAQVTASILLGATPLDVIGDGTARCSLEPFTSRLAIARKWLESGGNVATADVRRQLGNGIAAQASCVTAIYLALRFRDQPFLHLQRFVADLGGDADTIGAMAGALWGAANGFAMLPAAELGRLEQRDKLLSLATSLHQRVSEAEVS